MRQDGLDYHVTVVGGGVVGLAIAECLSRRTDRLALIERHPGLGWETSSRNSEVIHSGIYYPTGSNKARLCTEGRERLYDFCARYDIGHRRCGKLIVATSSDEVAHLDRIETQGATNGVQHIYRMSADESRRIEPAVNAVEALYVPSTGIIDSHGLMVKLSKMTEGRGGDIVLSTTLKAVDLVSGGYRLDVMSAGEAHSFTTRFVINAAGLEADLVAGMIGLARPTDETHYARGHYFRLVGSSSRIVGRLVYPVPSERLQGLGIHATIDLGGAVKLGPDVQYLDNRSQDYQVNPALADTFFEVAKRYLPSLRKVDLVPDQAGIRPKVKTKDGAVQDFIIRDEASEGHPCWINLIGIESPGLTSCLAIAEKVAGLCELMD